MSALAVVDTNVLVYRYDARDPRKQTLARELLRQGVADDSIRLPHQAVIEFVATVTRHSPKQAPILARENALREAEELLSQFTLLYPNETLVRTAIRGMATYQLSWFGAHLW